MICRWATSVASTYNSKVLTPTLHAAPWSAWQTHILIDMFFFFVTQGTVINCHNSHGLYLEGRPGDWLKRTERLYTGDDARRTSPIPIFFITFVSPPAISWFFPCATISSCLHSSYKKGISNPKQEGVVLGSYRLLASCFQIPNCFGLSSYLSSFVIFTHCNASLFTTKFLSQQPKTLL